MQKLSISDKDAFFGQIESFLNFNVFKDMLRNAADSESAYNAVLGHLQSLQHISRLHSFLLETSNFMCGDLAVKFKRGNIMDLFFRSMRIRLCGLEFEDIKECYENFVDYINCNSSVDSELVSFIDRNAVFCLEKEARETLENVKKAEFKSLIRRIDRLRVSDHFKEELKETIKGVNNNYIKSLFATEFSRDREDFFISENQTKIHNFIDFNIHSYFISTEGKEMTNQNFLQRAVLTKAFLNLKDGNIEEAEISFNNSLRFGQTNGDNLTIHQSLLNLIHIQFIKEDFRKMINYLGNLFSLFNLDPYYLLCAYFYYIDVDKEVNIDLYLNELKNNPQMDLNKIELVNHTYKDLLSSFEENYFNKKGKKCDAFSQMLNAKNLINLKLLDSADSYDVSAGEIIFERVNIGSVDNDFGSMILWKYLNNVD